MRADRLTDLILMEEKRKNPAKHCKVSLVLITNNENFQLTVMRSYSLG